MGMGGFGGGWAVAMDRECRENGEHRAKQSAWSTLDNGDNGGEVIRPVERGKGRD